jgi:uncharacterized protein
MSLEDPTPGNDPFARRGSPRGFAALDPQQRRILASRGGRAAHASGNAHEFTREEARAAGRRRHELETQRRTKQT